MRLGVLDVGSNTVHLLIVDAQPGMRMDPVRSVKEELRLAELLDREGGLSDAGAEALVGAVRRARLAAEEEQVEDFLAFATSAVRDAPNSGSVLDQVRSRTGVELAVLPAEEEARLTFLAVRRWFGWSTGHLLCLDIGGGSLEVATGPGEVASVAVSFPLGAGRLSRQHLAGDHPTSAELEVARTHVRTTMQEGLEEILAAGQWDQAVVTSKTFRSLARLGGAAPYAAGPYVPRALTRQGLERSVQLLAGLTVAERSALPGVSRARAPQLLAGALVASESFVALGVDSAAVCPWALREGMVLHHVDTSGDPLPHGGQARVP
ncbi:MAG TPA: hypothetical protein VNA30_06045 [Mycobacteriales bacterium]|nr:hypothetical protein [Mycobacteriales bacterium]